MLCFLWTLTKFSAILFAILNIARYYLRNYVFGTLNKGEEVSCRGKIVVITGASAGIGQAAALEFVQRDAHVILACRDLTKAEKTIKWIRNQTLLGEVTCMKLNLASLQSVRDFVKEFKSKYDHIDILVNNAGVSIPPEQNRTTEDGFEINMGTNHLGHFLLTNLLLDVLKKAENSRIVVVASEVHAWSTLNVDDIMSDKDKYSDAPKGGNVVAHYLYCRSKMANMLFSKELSKKLEGSGVMCTTMSPGLCMSDLGSSFTGWKQIAIQVLMATVMPYLAKSSAEGAETIMMCALNKTVKHGEYYYQNKYWDPSTRAILKDTEAKKLWDVSTKLAKL